MTTQRYFCFTLTMHEPGGVGRPAPMRKDEPDIVIDTDVNGLPHIPATTLAGALRDLVDRGGPGGTERARRWFGHVDGDSSAASAIWVLGSRLIDEDGELVSSVQEDATSVLTTTAIDRKSGAARTGSLRSIEQLPAGTSFRVHCRWDGENQDDWSSFVDLLLDSWEPLIGRGTSTGHGACRVTSLSTGVLDRTTDEGLMTWLTLSGPALAEAVSQEQVPCDVDRREASAYLVKLALVGPMAWALNSDGELPKDRVFPAASVKGVIRSRMEFILRSVGILDPDACGGPGCGECLVCNIFGHTSPGTSRKGTGVGLRAAVRTRSAVVSGTVRERTHTPIDRWTGGVGMQSKDEAVIHPATHRGGMTHKHEGIEAGELTLAFEPRALDDSLRDGFEALLRLVLQDMDDGLVGLGRATTRGYGSVAVCSATCPDNSDLMDLESAQRWLAERVAQHPSREQVAG